MALPIRDWLSELARRIADSSAISTQHGHKWWKRKLNLKDRAILAAALLKSANSICWQIMDDYGQPKICTAPLNHDGEHKWEKP